MGKQGTGPCGPRWTPLERTGHSCDSDRTWSSLPGAAATPALDWHDLQTANSVQTAV
jgi:hypothetical protein